jgi:hypothetical protein
MRANALAAGCKTANPVARIAKTTAAMLNSFLKFRKSFITAHPRVKIKKQNVTKCVSNT